MNSSIKKKFYLFLLTLTAILLIIFLTPIRQQLTAENINRIYKDISSSPAAIPLYTVVMSIAVAVMLPSFIFIVAAGLLFGPITGSIVSIIGVNLGSFLAFISGRTFLHDFTARHIHRINFLKKLNNHAEKNGLFFVMVSRMILIIPWNVFNYAVSLSTVKTRDYFMGTLIGTLPDILIINFFGASVKDAFKNPKVLIIPGLLLITLFITAMLIRKKFLKD